MKPNLLFLFTDEQRADTLACYGNDFIQMPNLNQLAECACVFENGYVTQAVCTPSRASIMTGLYPHSCGCTANNIALAPEFPTIAEMLPDEYDTAYFGKWHLGDEVIAQHGFDTWVSIDDGYRAHYSSDDHLDVLSDYHHFLVRKGVAPNEDCCGARIYGRDLAADLPEPLTKSAFLAEEAVRFLTARRAQPFCLYVNFFEPHMPFHGPFDGMYDPAVMPVPDHFLAPPGPGQARIKQLLSQHYLGSVYGRHDLTSAEGWRLLRSWYYAQCTQVDMAVGRILAALERSGQAEDTIIVFTSDHGDMMGDHGCLAKTLNYGEAIKVPWLMKLPGQSKKRCIPGRAGQIDLVPTLLDLMGVPVPVSLEGKSLAPVLRGESDLSGNNVFVEWNGDDGGGGMANGRPHWQDPDLRRIGNAPWRSVITADGWKLSLSPDDQGELFDLENDPAELTNRFADPEQAGRIDAMTENIRAWQRATHDTMPLPVKS